MLIKTISLNIIKHDKLKPNKIYTDILKKIIILKMTKT